MKYYMNNQMTTTDDSEKGFDEEFAKFSIDNILYWLWRKSGDVYVEKISKTARCVTIPSHVEFEGKTYPVTKFPNAQINGHVKCIVIPYTADIFLPIGQKVSYIIDKDNPNFTSYDGALYSKDMTFLYGCPIGKTGEFIIPDTVKIIFRFAFCDCIGLTSIVISDSVTFISFSAFSGCINLKTIFIPANVVSLRCESFDFYDGEIVISADNPKYTIIDDCLYDKECHILMRVSRSKSGLLDIPEGTIDASDEAFVPAENINAIRIPQCFKYNPEAFGKLHALDSIELAEGNEGYVLENDILYSKDKSHIVKATTAVKEFTLPASVTSIGYGAFLGCRQLKSLTIPETIANVGAFAFAYCPVLDDVYSYLTDVNSGKVCEDDCFDETTAHCTLHVLPGSKKEYRKSEQWHGFKKVVEDLK